METTKNKIKIGDRVAWLHKTSPSCGDKKKKMFGKVIDIFESVIGGKKKATVARILVDFDEYWNFINRKTTTVKICLLEKD